MHRQNVLIVDNLSAFDFRCRHNCRQEICKKLSTIRENDRQEKCDNLCQIVDNNCRQWNTICRLKFQIVGRIVDNLKLIVDNYVDVLRRRSAAKFCGYLRSAVLLPLPPFIFRVLSLCIRGATKSFQMMN